MTRRLARVGALLFATATPFVAHADVLDLSVDVDGLRSDCGEVRGALYASPDGWTNEGRQVATCVARIDHHHARCAFADVPPGDYAIALLHDENDDGRMNTDLFGFPQEGFAFSNDAAPGLGPPSFSAARFTHGTSPTAIRVHARYGL